MPTSGLPIACHEHGCSFAQKEAPLLTPDVLVCSVGTEIFFESTGEADKEWAAELDRGWDRSGAVAAAGAIPELKQQARPFTHSIVPGRVFETHNIPTCHRGCTDPSLSAHWPAQAFVVAIDLAPKAQMACSSRRL